MGYVDPSILESQIMLDGVLLNLLGSTIINLGSILMKKGVIPADDLPEGTSKPCKGLWCFGVLLFLFGNIFNFASLSMANLSLLSSIGSIQFVTNVIFSRLILSEPVTRTTLAGTFIIVGGDVIVALASPKQSDRFDAADLRDRYTDTTYLSYVGLLVFLTAAAQYVYYLQKRAGAGGGTIAAISFAMASALFGTQSQLQGKCLATLLSQLPNNHDRQVIADNAGFCAGVWMLWLVATWWWIRRMTMALRRFPAFIIPILQVFWIVVSILNGMFYFKESAYMSFSDRLGFIFGMVVVVLGVTVLASQASDWRLRLPERLGGLLRPSQGASQSAAGLIPGSPGLPVVVAGHGAIVTNLLPSPGTAGGFAEPLQGPDVRHRLYAMLGPGVLNPAFVLAADVGASCGPRNGQPDELYSVSLQPGDIDP